MPKRLSHVTASLHRPGSSALNSKRESYYQGDCSLCDRKLFHAHLEAIRLLRSLGHLRREPKPATELVCSLLQSAQGSCPCGGTVRWLAIADPFEAEFETGSPKKCEVCGSAIPIERLELFPDSTRCAGCQDKPAPASQRVEDDFCPQCGELMVMRTSRSGISRYRWTCPRCDR